MLARETGLKTTYYLRTLAATQVEKSTVDVNRYGVQPRWMKNKSASDDISVTREGAPLAGQAGQVRVDAGEAPVAAPTTAPATDMTNVDACSLDNPDLSLIHISEPTRPY